ncbi:MAG TPA: Uma2 family endonuclease [Pirellulales bacterium]|nr:Uma2 family endonuclease [Pirellulales bacterium]
MATLEELRSLEPPAGGSVRLSNIPWDVYETLRNQDENRHIRMTYVRGILEMMSPSKRHERVASILGRLIEAWTEVKGLGIQSCRMTTFKRQDLQSGLEPDNCYYLQHEPQVRNRDELDLSIDPPPDLAVEVDVSSSSLDRLPVYAAIGVPEVWRWRREQIQVHRLEGDCYRTFDSSQTLAGFPIGEAADLLRERLASDDNALVRKFRNLISTNPAGGAGQGSA